MFLVFSIIHFRESNQILYLMMMIFAFKKGELKEKTQDANFSLPIKTSEIDQNLGGFRIRIVNPNTNPLILKKRGGGSCLKRQIFVT